MRFTQLRDDGDRRGASCGLPGPAIEALGGVHDVHLMTLHAGHVRGNHYHRDRDELLAVMGTSRWRVRWEDPDGSANERIFDGPTAVLVTVDRMLSHAVINDGPGDLVMVSIANGPFDPEHPDSYPKPLA